jgi:glycosyltransferase involved in cell wall biosynthesis
MFITAYSILITVIWVILSVYLLVSSGRVNYLKDVSVPPDLSEPSLAIIIAVKDEEREVEEALKSACRLEYSNFRIIVIDDRSTDQTPVILKRMAQFNPAISVITIRSLQPGWLGKTNALYKGYAESTEEWLLFTDADVIFNQRALKKAVSYLKEKRLDHLAVIPEITSRSLLFKSILNTFALMLEIRQRPWDIPDASSSASIGIGAFNLVKRTSYEKAGTHRAISMRPDDDLKLGERIKSAGLRQDVLYGDKEVSLEWYTSLNEFVKGLMKNSFAVFDYRLYKAVGAAILAFLVFVLPLPFLLLSGSPAAWLALVIMVSQTAVMLLKKGLHGKWWHGVMIPVAGLVMVYIILISAIKTLKQEGIYWRGTFYPLADLKGQK